MTFSLRNEGSTFQWLMDRVLAGLAFTFVYLDNIIIASPTLEQHQQDVEEVFCHLQAAGLVQAAKNLRPLTDFTKGSPKGTVAVEWSPPMVAAFEAARSSLSAAALLAHPPAAGPGAGLDCGHFSRPRESGPEAAFFPFHSLAALSFFL
jgi:hypothetical protein